MLYGETTAEAAAVGEATAGEPEQSITATTATTSEGDAVGEAAAGIQGVLLAAAATGATTTSYCSTGITPPTNGGTWFQNLKSELNKMCNMKK